MKSAIIVTVKLPCASAEVCTNDKCACFSVCNKKGIVKAELKSITQDSLDIIYERVCEMWKKGDII